MRQKLAANLTDIQEFVSILLLGIAIAISTFPSVHLSYNIGIDAPMMWLSNYFYDTGWQHAQDVIFPHGPLAFLVYPTSPNIELAIIVECLLKLLLCCQLARLFDKKTAFRWLLAFVVAYIIVLLSNFIFLIIFSIILCYCNYFENELNRDKYVAFLLTACAFYIKSYVGIISCLVSGSFVLHQLMVKKKLKPFAVDIIILILLIFSIWILIYGTGAGFLRYCYGLFNLAQDNSSAAAYYPDNNWYFLLPFLLFSFTYPFIYRSKRSVFFAAITSLSFFAAWKHGMAREDVYHIRGTYHFAIITYLIFYIFNRKQHFSFLIFAGLSLTLFKLNMPNAYAYQPKSYRLMDGSINFVQFVSNLDKTKATAEQKNIKNIKCNKLPAKVVQKIGEASVDVYPWDYSIIPANGFNFQPRPILQSYAAYTSWLDRQDALHFASSQAPDYLIWDLKKITTGLDLGTMSSLDWRHLLNDEPQMLRCLLEQYKLWYNDQDYLVYKQRKEPLKSRSMLVKTDTCTWGKWLPCPSNSGALLRAKIHFSRTWMQRLKSFFYKDEQFYVYYKLADQSVHKFRIVPKNAADGLWIHPFINNPEHPQKQQEVVAIALDASNKQILTQSVEVVWEAIGFGNQKDVPETFFGKTNPPFTTLLSAIQPFEGAADSLWSNYQLANVCSDEALSGQQSYKLSPHNYSCSYKITFDSSYLNKRLQISTSCWVKGASAKASKKISLVSVVEHQKESLLWKNQKLSTHMLDDKAWNCMTQHLQYRPQKAGEQLQVYLWNNSDTSIFVDDLQLSVRVLSE